MTKQKNVLEVEVVDIRKIMGDGNLKAFADVKLAGSVIVKGFSVVKGAKGVFITMPRKASKDGRWFDILVPANDETKQEIEEKILEAYEKEEE